MRRRSRKYAAELAYWRARRAEAALESGAEHYAWAFTTWFGLPAQFFAGKRMLDVGCGPRGSLEWADQAAERMGVDPLADAYRELHTRPPRMTYVAAPAEAIPFLDAHFDVVSCLNMLDHVGDVDATIAEIGRVAAPGATLLLVVDIGHEPTVNEPHRLDWDLPARFEAAWEPVERRDLVRHSPNMLATLQDPRPFDHADPAERPGVLNARFVRRGTEVG